MGLGPSKEKIRKILEHSITNSNISEQKNLKIEYKFIYAESAEAEDNPSAQMKGGRTQVAVKMNHLYFPKKLLKF